MHVVFNVFTKHDALCNDLIHNFITRIHRIICQSYTKKT